MWQCWSQQQKRGDAYPSNARSASVSESRKDTLSGQHTSKMAAFAPPVQDRGRFSSQTVPAIFSSESDSARATWRTGSAQRYMTHNTTRMRRKQRPLLRRGNHDSEEEWRQHMKEVRSSKGIDVVLQSIFFERVGKTAFCLAPLTR